MTASAAFPPATQLHGPWRPCRATFDHLRDHAPDALLHLITAGQLDTANLSWAAEAAGQITALPADVVVGALLPVLKHPRPVVREGAVYGLHPHLNRVDVWAALVTVARSDTSATLQDVAGEALFDYLNDRDETWFIRPWRASHATFDHLAAHAPEDLLGYLTRGWLTHPQLAFAALAAQYCPNDRLVPALCALLTHPRAYVVEGALGGLAAYRSRADVRAAVQAAQPHPCPAAQRLLEVTPT